MRLIDADQLVTEMKINIGNIYNPDIIKGMKFGIDLINSRPTAFDPEKLGEEILEWMRATEDLNCPYDYSLEICEQYSSCEDCRNAWLTRIVKKGGVSNE